MSSSVELDITRSDEKVVFKKYMLPSMLSMLAVAGYSFVDTFVVGQAIGAEAVAAMGICTPVLCLLFALGFLFGAGGAVRYSIYKELGQIAKAKNAYTVSVTCTVLLGVLFCILGNIFIEPLVRFLGASEANAGLSVSYLRWILSLAMFMMTDIALGCYMRNEGHPNVSMTATLMGTGLNIVLDFLFVMVFDWGMAGASSATCIGSIVAVSVNLGYAIIKKTGLKFSLKGLYIKEVFPIMQTGLGSFVLEGATAAIPLCFNNVGGRTYGDAGISAFTVIVTINLVIYALLNGVAQGMQPLVSANYGAGKPERIKKFLRYSLLFSVLLGVAFTAAAEIAPEWMCSLFVSDSAEALSLATKGLRLHAPAFMFMAVSIVLGIYFQSEEKAFPSFAILLGRSLLFPVVLLYAIGAVIGKESLWLAVPVGEAIAVVTAVLFKLRDSRKMSKL